MGLRLPYGVVDTAPTTSIRSLPRGLPTNTEEVGARDLHRLSRFLLSVLVLVP